MADEYEKIQCTVNNPCTAVQLLVQSVSALTQRVENCEDDFKEGMEKMSNRLPPWVTGAGWVLGLIIGCLATLVAI